MNTSDYLNQLKELDIDCLPLSDQKSTLLKRIAAKRKFAALPEENSSSYLIGAAAILLSKYSGSDEVLFLLSLNHMDKRPFYILADMEKTSDFLEKIRQKFTENIKDTGLCIPVELCVNTPADDEKILSFEVNHNEITVYARAVYTQEMVVGIADSFVNILQNLGAKIK